MAAGVAVCAINWASNQAKRRFVPALSARSSDMPTCISPQHQSTKQTGCYKTTPRPLWA